MFWINWDAKAASAPSDRGEDGQGAGHNLGLSFLPMLPMPHGALLITLAVIVLGYLLAAEVAKRWALAGPAQRDRSQRRTESLIDDKVSRARPA